MDDYQFNPREVNLPEVNDQVRTNNNDSIDSGAEDLSLSDHLSMTLLETEQASAENANTTQAPVVSSSTTTQAPAGSSPPTTQAPADTSQRDARPRPTPAPRRSRVSSSNSQTDIVNTNNQTDTTVNSEPATNNCSALENREREEEATRKYQVHLQSANLKEKAGNLTAAIEEYKKALEYEIIARGEGHPEVGKTHGLIGRMYKKDGQHSLAVVELEKELSIYREAGWTHNSHANQFWPAHDVLAQAYGGANKRQKQIENYELAIKILSESTTAPPERLAHMCNNVGNSYRGQGDLNKAREHLERSKSMMSNIYTSDNPSEEMAKVHTSLADIYRDLKMIREAIAEFESCVDIRRQLKPGPAGEVLRGSTYQTLSSLYQEIGNVDKSAEYRRAWEEALRAIQDPVKRQAMLDSLKNEVDNEGSVNGALGKIAVSLFSADDVSKAQQYQKENSNKEAVIHYNKAIEAINTLPDELRETEEVLTSLALCYNNLGNAYRKTQQLNEAETSLKTALELRRRLYADSPDDNTASTLFNLGHLLHRVGGRVNSTKAIEYHEECLDMYTKLGGVEQHRNWIVSIYRALGASYEKLGQSQKSVDNYEKAKEILLEKMDDLDELRAVYNNMGNSYESLANYPKAQEYLDASLNIALVLATERPNDLELQNHIAASHNNLGVMYQTCGRLNLSLEHLYKSRDIRESLFESSPTAANDLPSSYHNIGNTLMKMDKKEEALEVYLKELKIKKDLGHDTINLRITISNAYDKLGQIDKAEEILNDMD